MWLEGRSNPVTDFVIVDQSTLVKDERHKGHVRESFFGWQGRYCRPQYSGTPQWGAADAEIKDPSVEIPELQGFYFKIWSRSEYSHARFTYCQGLHLL